MNKTRYLHDSPADVLAMVLTACSFFAVWFLWPATKAGHYANTRVFQGTSYVFISLPMDNSRDPTQLVRPLLGSSGIGREDFDDREAIAPDRMDLAKLLGRPSSVGAAVTELDLDREVAERPVQAYLGNPALMSVPASVGGKIRVMVSGELTARAFDTSVLSGMSIPHREHAWIIRAFVALDAHGSVTQVLLETASEDVGLNAAVLQALYGSHGRKNGRPCEGLVTISANGKQPGTKAP